MNAAAADVVRGLQTWFQPEGKAPARKRTRAPNGGGAAGSSGSDGEVLRNPFGEHQSEWLKTVLQNTFENFGADVAKRFEAVEGRADNHESRIQALEQRLENSSKKFEERWKAHETKVQKEAEERKREEERLRVDAGHQRAPPPELRTMARMGNLGWDTPDTQLIERARTVLQTARVEESAYTELVPATGRAGTGSSVQIAFVSAERLQRARMAVRAAGVSFGGGRRAWLDVQKTRDELRPARAVHRIAECLEEFEAEKPEEQRARIVKEMATKSVRAEAQRMCIFRSNGVAWTPAGRDRYTEEQRDLAAGIAEAD